MTNTIVRKTALPAMLAFLLLMAAAAFFYWQPGLAAAQGDEAEKPAKPEKFLAITQLSTKPYYVEDKEYRIDREKHQLYTVNVQRLVCPSMVILVRWSAVSSSGDEPVTYVSEYRSTNPDLGEGVWTDWTSRGLWGRTLVKAIRHVRFGDTYEFRVAAVVDGVMGDYATARVETHSSELQAPTNLSVRPYEGLDRAMVLSWDNPGGHTTALVGHRVSGTADWEDETRILYEPDSPSILATGLEGGVGYDFRIIHVDLECAHSESSNIVRGTVPTVGPPVAPDFEAGVEYGGGEPVITVTPSSPASGVTGYTMRYRVNDSGSSYAEVTATREEALGGISTGAVSPGSVYEVGLKASNRSGDSGYTVREVRVSALPDPPAFTVTAVYRDGSASLLVRLVSPVSGAASYVVRVNGADSAVTLSEVSGDGLRIPAEPGTAYTVAMASVNEVGAGNFSGAQLLTTLSLPSQPDAEAEVQYSGGAAGILVSVAEPGAAEMVSGYALRHRDSGLAEAGWTSVSLTPAQAQAGHSIGAVLGATYAVEVHAENALGPGPAATLAVKVKEKADAPDFTAQAVYAGGSASVSVQVTEVVEGASAYSIRYRTGAGNPWTTALVDAADALAGWSFPAEPGTGYSVGVAARTPVGLGTYGAAQVSIASRVGMPEFTVVVLKGDVGPVARVTVVSPDAAASYHVVTVDGAAPVRVDPPAVQRDFPVLLGSTYRIGVAAGNQLGIGAYAYRSVLAVVVPEPPSFTLSPGYRQGSAHLVVDLVNPDPHAAHYLLKVGSGEGVRHDDAAMLSVPVVPGQTYTVGLAAGNSAGDSAYWEVTRATTEAEFEALLEWELVPPGQATPGGAVGPPTSYVSIVDGGPVRYDPVPPCMGRETSRVRADLGRALALSEWVGAMGDASPALVSYAAVHRAAMEAALTDARADAQAVCASRYPTVENLGLGDARWCRVPR